MESIAPNSGSEFSVLPAQNTSGNWVKVVQRIPVRIKVDRKDGRSGFARRHERRWRTSTPATAGILSDLF